MVILRRLQFLSNLLASGRCMTAHFSTNVNNHTEKLKIVVKPDVELASPCESCFLQAVLQYMESIAQEWPIVDRGHTHSDGSIVVCFYYRHNVPPGLNACSLRTDLSLAGHLTEVEPTEECVAPAFDAVQLIGTWEHLPEQAWEKIHARFAAHRWRSDGVLAHRSQASNVQLRSGREDIDARCHGMFREIWPVISETARHHGFRPRYMRVETRSQHMVLKMGYSGYGDRADHLQVKENIKNIILDASAARGFCPHLAFVVQDND
jgi:hypothetical protein